MSASSCSSANNRIRNSYLGPGKLEELRQLVLAADANVIAADDELTPRQERAIEAALGVAVIDRTAVILDIFARHANSAEGKLQVELAQLEYNLARMRGLWTHLERLGGGVGTRGPGETQIETDRRLARNRIATLRRRLSSVQRTREVMRRERERSQIPQVALAGYTNAGKSSLLQALTGAEVPVADRLFHTLDPTTRLLESGRSRLSDHRHRRLHPQAAPPARRSLRGDARGDAPRRADHPRRRCERAARRARVDGARGRGRARGDRRRAMCRGCSP